MNFKAQFFFVSWFVLASLVGCSNSSEQRVSPELVALNDRGVAQMGQFQYAAAHETFSQVVAEAPMWSTARVNLAIATLNKQDPGDELKTLEILQKVLTDDPQNVRALYTSGIVQLYLGEPQKAAEYLEQVVELDPQYAYAAYFLGQSLLQSENYAAAQEWLMRSIDQNESLRSAYWVAAMATRRLGDTEKAKRLVETYQQFEHNPLSVTAGILYKQMGP